MSGNLDKRSYDELNKAIDLIQHTVYKKYLAELEFYPLLKPTPALLDEDAGNCLRFFQLEKLTCKKGEDIFQKLSTVYHASMLLKCSLAVIIDVESIDAPAKIYLGVKNDGENRANLGTSFRTLKNGIKSNFPGTKFHDIPAQEGMSKIVEDIFGKHIKHISSVSCVAAARDKSKTENKSFIQGIERFIDTMRGNAYTAVFIAEPISNNEQTVMRQGYENLYSIISSFSKSIWSYNENESNAVMASFSEGISKSIAEGTNQTQAHSVNSSIAMGYSSSNFQNRAIGNSQTTPTDDSRAGKAMGSRLIESVFKDSLPVKILGAVTNTAGRAMDGESVTNSVTNTIGRTMGLSNTFNEGQSDTLSDSRSLTETIGESRTKTDGKTDTKGTGTTLQIENVNKPIQEMLKRIEEQLKRIQEGEDYGSYSCGAYFLAAKQESCLLAANTYRALMIGEGSSVESGAINYWKEPETVSEMKEYLKRFAHPIFALPILGIVPDEARHIAYTPGTVVSGLELPLHLGLPTKSVYGLPVIEHAEFGRNVTDESFISNEDAKVIKFGKIYHMGQTEEKAFVDINVEGLSSHTFITGSTGSGKSNAVYHILNEADKQGIKFLVVEPAKGEYKDVFGSRDDVSIYGTNSKKTDLLRINPFSFPEEVHILEHIDRLIEIFNVCWPMYAAMPAVLKDAVERAYIKAGWDLNESECKYISNEGVKLYPGFVDVLQQINIVMEESKYSSDSKGDYTGALCTRVKSLTNGLYSQIFTADELSDEDLYNKNVIVDLSRVDGMETKSLIMGLLIMKMKEFRTSEQIENNCPLRHLTVLEEAHNLLKRTSTEQFSETSNLLGKSVEMLANSIAEMRTYGEGFIIADQSPGLLDMSVIRNTNTKIILRLPDLSDRELVGKAAALNDDQITELSKLETGVAAVYQNNWLEPVLCKVNFFGGAKESKFKYNRGDLLHNNNDKKVDLVKYILNPTYEKIGFDKNEIKSLENSIYKMNLPAETKTSIFKYMKETDSQKRIELTNKIIYGIFNSETALNASNMERKNIKLWYDIMLDALNPDVSSLSEAEREMILVIIVNKYNEIKQSEVSTELYKNLFVYLNETKKKGDVI